MNQDVFLVLRGWNGNKPEHWQEYLVTGLRAEGHTVYYPQMPNPEEPKPDPWCSKLGEVLVEIRQSHPEARLTVLAHSMGAITWMFFVANHNSQGQKLADRVLLVAPPYILPEAVPDDAPWSVMLFFPPPFDKVAIQAAANQTVMVASRNDDYATFDQSAAMARELGVPIHELKDAGHISPYWGYGDWPWVYEWCLRQADLPPQPKPAG